MKLKQAERIRAAGRSAMVIYAVMLTIMIASMVYAHANVFSTMDTQVKGILDDAVEMLKHWVVPAGVIGIIVSQIIARLPGMDQQTVNRAKSATWASIFAVVVSYAASGLLSIAQTVGESITGGGTTTPTP